MDNEEDDARDDEVQVTEPKVAYVLIGDLRNAVVEQAVRSGWTVVEDYEPDDGSHVLSKRMKFQFSDKTVTGTAAVDFGRLAVSVWRYLYDYAGRRLDNTRLGWESDDDSVSHPHGVDDDPAYLCHELPFVRDEILGLTEAGTLPAWLVGVVEGAYSEFNQDSLGNGDWHQCPACGVTTHVDSHRCPAMGRRTGPTMDRFSVVGLVGCGVTGSWMMPVLSRVSRLVMVYDNDTVTRMNPHGRWSRRLTGRIRKVTAAIEPRYESATLASRQRFTRNVRVPRFNLLVLATDSAESRLEAVRNRWVFDNTWILDMRVAGNQLVVWCFTKENYEMYDTWKIDLESYQTDAEQCGQRHDNIPLVAGVMAASFLARWATRNPEQGIWNISLDDTWENMMFPRIREEEEMAPLQLQPRLGGWTEETDEVTTHNLMGDVHASTPHVMTEQELQDAADAADEERFAAEREAQLEEEEGETDALAQEGTVLVQPEPQAGD